MFGGIASGVSNEILKYSLVNSEPEKFKLYWKYICKNTITITS